MIIFGTRGITYTKDSGGFHCPECGSPESYSHKRVRRFFTLYFIPLIPLDLHGEYIECQRCDNTYKLDILKYYPEANVAAFEAEFHLAIKRIMIEMVISDDEVEDKEIQTLIGIYKHLTEKDLSSESLQREIDNAKKKSIGIPSLLNSIAGNLNDHGKEMVVRAAYLIAAADGVIHDKEIESLGLLQTALQLSPAHFKGILSEFQESQQGRNIAEE